MYTGREPINLPFRTVFAHRTEHPRSIARAHNRRWGFARLLNEVTKRLVVHVVHEDETALVYCRPHGSQFESHVASCVKAVMHEHVHLLEA